MTDAPRIGFAGLSHLGLCSAVAAAAKGFSVLGFDPDPAVAESVAAGRLPVLEPGLEALLREHRARLAFGADPAHLAECDVIYVAADVPTDDAGSSELGGIERLLDRVQAAADADACIVVLSQVPPGFTRAHARPGCALYYQVETLVFGRAVERALEPERFILGCADPRAPLPPALAAYLGAFGCPILPMRYESAELAKIAVNCCLAASISVANALAELSEHIGADWAEIAPALRLDRRIGAHAYLAPGLGIGGGNIERDLASVVRLAERHGTDGAVVRSFLANSAHRKDWAIRVLRAALLEKVPGATIGIWGLTYKENTRSIKNSPAIALIKQLSDCTLRVFDPEVQASVVKHTRLIAATDALDAARNADALAIMTPWPHFRRHDAAEVAERMRGRLLLDPYRLFDPERARMAGLDQRVLGAAPGGAG